MYEYHVIKNKYGQYAVPKAEGFNHNGGVANRISKGEVYEKKTIEFVEKNLNNKSMVHCGSYFGDMLPAFSKATTGTVYAYEANPISAWCAQKTIELNELENVVLTNIGLGSKNEKLNFITEYADGRSLGGGARLESSELPKTWTKDRFKGAKIIEIDIKPLDELITEEIGIIHLDVEGFEIEVLKGAIETINKYKPILILEGISGKEKFMIYDIIRLGYSKIQTSDGNSFWKWQKI